MVSELSRRPLRDPAALRALAHPARLKILEALALGGPATATDLAEQVDESPANCSWHLRQLARYGFIEEAGGGTGRQRPWRIVPGGNTWADPDEPDDRELARAGDAATEVLLDWEYGALRGWLAQRRSAPVEWRDAAFLGQNFVFLTPAELSDLGRDMLALLRRYEDRLVDPDRRPAGARPVRLVAWAAPAGKD
jgi:DNA-binding transcriptional ArsR family regulator